MLLNRIDLSASILIILYEKRETGGMHQLGLDTAEVEYFELCMRGNETIGNRLVTKSNYVISLAFIASNSSM